MRTISSLKPDYSGFREGVLMSVDFNYRHLYYFWVVAKEGGMVRAADRLDMAVQTVSTQVRELERSLGHTLLKVCVCQSCVRSRPAAVQDKKARLRTHGR